MKKHETFINGRKIGPDAPPYVIAELSANHNGSLERALETIAMAKAMGADAIKLQTYTADTLTINCDKDDFQIHGGLWDGYNLYQLYEQAHTPFEWHEALFEQARKVGITCFSSPFDETAIDLLEELDVPAYKIASFEAIDHQLIRYVAKTGKPMIISTGMANLEEIKESLMVARESGAEEIVLLHCVSGYPAPLHDVNLSTMVDMGKQFDVLVGLSDHTLGTTVAIASVALGASVIEKHVTLSRKIGGVDAAFSLEPEELKSLCKMCNDSWIALGQVNYELKGSERDNIKFRRSLYVVKDVEKGKVLEAGHVRSIRPGYGLAPKYMKEVLGKKVTKNITRGSALDWSMIE